MNIHIHQAAEAIFAGHDCFLNQPKWKRLCEGLALESNLRMPSTSALFHGTVPVANKWSDVYFVLQVQLPPIIRAGYNIRQGRSHGIEPGPEQVARLRPKAESLRLAFLAWYDDYASQGAFADPIEVPSMDPTSPYEMVLEHRNPWEGSITMSYWASMLILQECLNQCHSGSDLPFRDNEELAHKVLRSIESVGQGLMGPHRVGYSLRVAYDFVDERAQAWMLSKVTRYNDTYAALSTDVYPANSLFDQTSSSQVERCESQPLSWID